MTRPATADRSSRSRASAFVECSALCEAKLQKRSESSESDQIGLVRPRRLSRLASGWQSLRSPGRVADRGNQGGLLAIEGQVHLILRSREADIE